MTDIDVGLHAVIQKTREELNWWNESPPPQRIDKLIALARLQGAREFHDQGRARGWRTAHEVLEAQIEALLLEE